MSSRSLSRTALLSLGLLAGAASALAGPIVPIPGLFNTGVDSSGNVLTNETVGDPHYSLVQKPAASSGDIRVFTSASGFPIGPYIGDNDLSRWIMPKNGSAGSWTSPAGTYGYRTTFTLTDMIHTTAQISGQWTSDNEGLQIALNGVAVPGIGPTAFEQFRNWSTFSITSGFAAGLNTLDFFVTNPTWSSANPTALRVEMTGTVEQDSNAIPVPDGGAALMLLGLGLVSLSGVRGLLR